MRNADRTVTVHIRCALDSGTVVESSAGRAPLDLRMAGSKVLPIVVEAVAAIEVTGAVAEMRVQPMEGYGPRRDDLVFSVAVEAAPQGLVVGQRVRLGLAPAVVAAVDESQVLIDANHPLAGQALRFEVELVEHRHGEFSPFAFIEQAPWRFARTMPHIPHWYSVRGQTPEDEFEACIRYIREHGYEATYRGPMNAGRAFRTSYLAIGSWKYWTMGASVEETTIINRAAIHAQPPWTWNPIEPEVEKLTAEEVREELTGQTVTEGRTWTAI